MEIEQEELLAGDYSSRCFLSLPHDFETIREGLRELIKDVEGHSYFVIESQGDTLRNEIKRGLDSSAVLIADLSSPPDGEERKELGPRPAIMWEVGYAEHAGLNTIFICQEKDEHYVPAILSDFHIIYYDLNKTKTLFDSVSKTLQKVLLRARPGGPQAFPAQCFVDRSTADLDVRYLGAKKVIKILELNLETVTEQSGVLARALNKNSELSVQILTLNPFSVFAENRAEQLADMPLSYRRTILESIESLWRSLGTIDRERWEIRIYDTFPTQIMFQLDESMIHSVISLGRRSRDLLHFEVNRYRPNASDTFEAHFAQLWSASAKYEDWKKENRKAVTKLLPGAKFVSSKRASPLNTSIEQSVNVKKNGPPSKKETSQTK